MKLRNKKTGEITEAISIHDGFICVDWKGDSGIYSTLASLNNEFEDYKPAEPLIKDEKVRKAVRAWAEVLGVERATYSDIEGEFYSGVNYIRLGQVNRLEPLKGDTYTIAELCGEGEG